MSPDAKRSSMNGLYGALRQATTTPRWVVKAYVSARFNGGDRTEACAHAHFGVPMARLGPGGREAVLGWVNAMADAELARGAIGRAA